MFFKMYIQLIHVFLLSFNLLFFCNLSVASDQMPPNLNPTRREASLILHQCVQRLNNLRKIKEDMQVCNEANQILNDLQNEILEYWKSIIGSNWPLEKKDDLDKLEEKALKKSITMLGAILHSLSREAQSTGCQLDLRSQMAKIFCEDCYKIGGISFLDLIRDPNQSVLFNQTFCSLDDLKEVSKDVKDTLYSIWLLSDKILDQAYQNTEYLVELFDRYCIPPLPYQATFIGLQNYIIKRLNRFSTATFLSDNQVYNASKQILYALRDIILEIWNDRMDSKAVKAALNTAALKRSITLLGIISHHVFKRFLEDHFDPNGQSRFQKQIIDFLNKAKIIDFLNKVSTPKEVFVFYRKEYSFDSLRKIRQSASLALYGIKSLFEGISEKLYQENEDITQWLAESCILPLELLDNKSYTIKN